MSNMHDHPEHVRGVQEPYSSYNTPLILKADDAAGTSNNKGKSTDENLPPSSSGDEDEAQTNSELLNAWMQRLQVLTVVTAFLASMDGELFSLTALNTQIGVSMRTTARELVYACLAGALIFHICATIIGYVASFALIRYRIVDASGGDGTTKRLPRRIVLEPVRPLQWPVTFLQRPERLRLLSISRRSSQTSPPPPLTLVTRCYYTTLCLTAAGFILALTGILAYVWAGLRMSVGIFSTVCLAVAIGAGVWAIAM